MISYVFEKLLGNCVCPKLSEKIAVVRPNTDWYSDNFGIPIGTSNINTVRLAGRSTHSGPGEPISIPKIVFAALEKLKDGCIKNELYF